MTDHILQEHWVVEADLEIKELLTTIRSVWRPKTLANLYRNIESTAREAAEKFEEAERDATP